MENGGHFFRDLEPDAIREGLTPRALRRAIRKGGTSLGTLGGGNHFLELQEIVEVLDARDLFDRGRHPYTRELAQAVPIPDPEVARARRMRREPPS